MNLKIKHWAVCILVIFLVPFFAYSMGTQEKPSFKFRPGDLIVLNEADDSEIEYEDMYAQGSKGNIIVFSVMFGYQDKNGTTHFPAAQTKLSEAKVLIGAVDFKVTKSARVRLLQFTSGPVVGLNGFDEGDEITVNAKKNVIYRQFLYLDLTEADPEYIPPPGLYDLGIFVVPDYSEWPMNKSGGMTYAFVRAAIKK